MRDLGVAIAICAVIGFGVSKCSRYGGQRARGFAVGLLCGLLMVLPLAALPLFLIWPDIPDGIADASIVAVILYEITLWARIARHLETPATERLKRPRPARKAENPSLALLEEESTPA